MKGPRILQQAGNIPYVSGRQGNPLQLPKFGLAYALDLHVSGTMSITQPAGAGAPTFQAGGPWNLLQQHLMTVNGLSFNSVMSGRGLYLASLLARRGMAVPYTAPLPPANGGTQPVTTPEAWTWNVTLPIATSERDHNSPVGLINLQNQAVTAYTRAIWATEATILNLPNASTASFTGSVEERLVLMEAPTTEAEFRAIQPLLGNLHVWEEQPAVIAAGTAAPRILLPVGDVYQRIAVLLSYQGSPDLTNQSGLQTLRLSYGGFYQVDDSAQSIQYRANGRYDGNLPGDCYLLDFSTDLPNELLDATRLPQLNLDLIFAAAPANTTVSLLLERYRQA